jgi:hypothetical protein
MAARGVTRLGRRGLAFRSTARQGDLRFNLGPAGMASYDKAESGVARGTAGALSYGVVARGSAGAVVCGSVCMAWFARA